MVKTVKLSEETWAAVGEIKGGSMEEKVRRLLDSYSSPTPTPTPVTSSPTSYSLTMMDKAWVKSVVGAAKQEILDSLADALTQSLSSSSSSPSSSSSSSSSLSKTYYPWEKVQSALFEHGDEVQWVANREEVGESDALSEATFFSDGVYLYSDFYGSVLPLLRVTPVLLSLLA